MSYPQEWYIQDKINAAVRDCAKSHEVHALSSHVDRLEHSLRESRAETAGLRNELSELRQSLGAAQDALIQLQQLAHSALSEPEKHQLTGDKK